MLKHVDRCIPEVFYGIETNLLLTRIICYADCYGFDKSFLDIWYGENMIISKFDNIFTVWADDSADFVELREFLDIIGAKDVITSEKVAEKLKYTVYTVKSSYEFVGETTFSDMPHLICDDDIIEAYSLISDVIPDSFSKDRNSYLTFLSDFKFRQNRGYARGCCITDNGRLCAVGFTSSETDSGAILSGIACHAEYRRSGYGKIIVHSLLSSLISEGKRVFVIALNDSAKGFYEHIGFTECEAIAYISLTNENRC